MEKVVHQLRKAREAKGIELKEVEEITKIRRKYLTAMEEENYHVLPGGAYTIGYLRTYARFLDLDADSLVNSFRMEATEPEVEKTPDNPIRKINSLERDRSIIVKFFNCLGR